MNLFHDYTFTWEQVSFLKLAVLFVGIAIGSYWSRTFKPYAAILAVLGIVIGLYLTYVIFW